MFEHINSTPRPISGQADRQRKALTRPVVAHLERTTFQTSRLLDFCSEKELVAKTGQDRDDWPLVILKELLDNALDACEEKDVAPEISVTVDDKQITVADNGPGIPTKTIDGITIITEY